MNEDVLYCYYDETGNNKLWGPFDGKLMRNWYTQDYFTDSLRIIVLKKYAETNMPGLIERNGYMNPFDWASLLVDEATQTTEGGIRPLEVGGERKLLKELQQQGKQRVMKDAAVNTDGNVLILPAGLQTLHHNASICDPAPIGLSDSPTACSPTSALKSILNIPTNKPQKQWNEKNNNKADCKSTSLVDFLLESKAKKTPVPVSEATSMTNPVEQSVAKKTADQSLIKPNASGFSFAALSQSVKQLMSPVFSPSSVSSTNLLPPGYTRRKLTSYGDEVVKEEYKAAPCIPFFFGVRDSSCEDRLKGDELEQRIGHLRQQLGSLDSKHRAAFFAAAKIVFRMKDSSYCQICHAKLINLETQITHIIGKRHIGNILGENRVFLRSDYSRLQKVIDESASESSGWNEGLQGDERASPEAGGEGQTGDYFGETIGYDESFDFTEDERGRQQQKKAMENGEGAFYLDSDEGGELFFDARSRTATPAPPAQESLIDTHHSYREIFNLPPTDSKFDLLESGNSPAQNPVLSAPGPDWLLNDHEIFSPLPDSSPNQQNAFYDYGWESE